MLTDTPPFLDVVAYAYFTRVDNFVANSIKKKKRKSAHDIRPLKMWNNWCQKHWISFIEMGLRGILGFEYGIVQAPLGPDISSPQLVAAVANAGALGFLRVPDWVYLFFST